MTHSLTLVEGGRSMFAARGTDLERVIDLSLSRDAAGILARVMEGSQDRNDLRSFTRTWPELRAFALKLATTLTEYVPGVDPTKTLLQEALEAACFGYLSAGGSAPPCLDVARFFGGGVAIAARGLGALQIVAEDSKGSATRWDPKQGGMGKFLDDLAATRVAFRLRAPAPPAERVALRNFVVQQTLKFEDDVTMVRAGVDYKTFEPF